MHHKYVHLRRVSETAEVKSERLAIALIAAGGLSTEKKMRSHFNDEVLVRMLSFLFRADNVQLLSWGTKRVVYGGTLHRFPAVGRKTSEESLWRRFKEEINMG